MTCSASGDPEELEIAKEDPQTRSTADNNTSIMSFFKTLVSHFLLLFLPILLLKRYVNSKNNAYLDIIVPSRISACCSEHWRAGTNVLVREGLHQPGREGALGAGNHGVHSGCPNCAT